MTSSINAHLNLKKKQKETKKKLLCFSGYTLSGMDRDSMPDFFIPRNVNLN